MPRNAIEVLATLGGGSVAVAILAGISPPARQLLFDTLRHPFTDPSKAGAGEQRTDPPGQG